MITRRPSAVQSTIGGLFTVDERRQSARNLRSPSGSRLVSAPLLTPRHAPPDVILMDSNMPKMNGPDAVFEIRKMGYTFPIFGVTGDEDHAGFHAAGADGVMMKPVRAAELIKTLHLALAKSLKGEAVNVKLPAVSGLFSPRFTDLPGRYVSPEYVGKMEGWLEAHATATVKRKKFNVGDV